jgi:uncharacterized RmlC-like cupin family protein
MMSVVPDHARIPGHSLPISAGEMQSRIARFAELKPDLAAFPDLKDPARMRSVSYVISPEGRAGPAAITAPHNFHMAVLEMSKGVRPSTHAHPYNEIFMPLDAKFRFFWGENLEQSVLLGPFDVISVPGGVFRTFENTEHKLGHVVSIFDIAGDPHVGIIVPQELFDQYYQSWRPGMEPR